MPAMKTRRIVLHGQTRAKLQRLAKRCKDADTRIRYRIVLLSGDGWSGKRIIKALGCSASTVSRTLDRFESYGAAGLVDRREDNGQTKADGAYARTVAWILESTPKEFFHRRPTWTRQLLIDTAGAYTGVVVSVTTMGRLLKGLKVRRGRPKPTAPCPWSESARKTRVAAIHALIDALPATEAAVWEDEADVDLNPRIGLDYMLPGTQRTVPTPGRNVKRYFAAAMDASGSDRIVWVKGERKNSRLFLDLLKKLLAAPAYADKAVIHVVLDNYTIHSSRQTRWWLAEFGGKFRLHFLPPYCPDDNRIERKVWREMHANVTVNHRCSTIDQLVAEVVYYLMSHNRKAEMKVRQLRTAI
jgi:transposase